MPSLSILVLVAAPELCRPYATQFSQSAVNSLWLKGYTLCLNADEVPALPSDWVRALEMAWPRPQVEPKLGGSKVDDPPKVQKVQGASAPWIADCRKRHPRGFDSKTLTYNAFIKKAWRAVPCPKF